MGCQYIAVMLHITLNFKYAMLQHFFGTFVLMTVQPAAVCYGT